MNPFKMIQQVIMGVLFIGAGLFALLEPYDKFCEIFPKAPAKRAVRVLGAVVVVCGIIIIILTIIRICLKF